MWQKLEAAGRLTATIRSRKQRVHAARLSFSSSGPQQGHGDTTEKGSLAVNICADLTQARVIWKGESLTEELPPSDWPAGRSGLGFIVVLVFCCCYFVLGFFLNE